MRRSHRRIQDLVSFGAMFQLQQLILEMQAHQRELSCAMGFQIGLELALHLLARAILSEQLKANLVSENSDSELKEIDF